MPRALVDTTVLFAAAYRRDGAHDDGLAVLSGIDDGSLPEAVVVVDYVLAETLNSLLTRSGQDAATEFLDRLERNEKFHTDTLDSETRRIGKAVFRRHAELSFVDAMIAAYTTTAGHEYLCAFDDDFDAVDGLTRLATPSNPYRPS